MRPCLQRTAQQLGTLPHAQQTVPATGSGELAGRAARIPHVERDLPKRSQKSYARERIRSGRPQPLPGPGVLSSGNSIGTPALLPDGSISHESVMVGSQVKHPNPNESSRELEELRRLGIDVPGGEL